MKRSKKDKVNAGGTDAPLGSWLRRNPSQN